MSYNKSPINRIYRLIASHAWMTENEAKVLLVLMYASGTKSLGLEVHAGHGMEYKTAKILSKVREIEEFNIGHFIIGESIIFGLKTTIGRFKKILK